MIEAFLPPWLDTTTAIASVLALLVAVLAVLYLSGPKPPKPESGVDE